MDVALVAAFVVNNVCWAVVCWTLLRDRAVERRDAMIERGDLTQRIQAPERAVAEHAIRDVEMTPEERAFAEEIEQATLELSQVGTVITGDGDES